MQSLNNQSNIPLRGNAIYIGSWDDIIKYQNIQINLNTDTNCEITYYKSNDKVFIENDTFQYTANTNYFNSINSTSRYVYFTVRNLQNVIQNNFNFSVLYKDYPVSGGGIASNVTIDNPLNQDGSVFVGGNLALTGDVNANITNQSLDVNVLNPVNSVDANIVNQSLDVNVLNPVNSVDANIVNQSLDVNVLNSSIAVSGSVSVSNLNDLSGVRVDISGETVNVSNLSDISGIYVNNTQLNKLTFDSDNNLEMNLNNINSGFIQSGGLKSYIVNTSLAVTNSALSNMSFSLGNLNVKDTQNSYTTGALNVYDASSNTTLTNIYNCVNTRGSGIFIQGSITMGGYTSVIDLSTLPVKCLTIYGISSDATILTVLFSQDGSSFYASQYSYTLATANNFGFALTACPKYICLQTSEAVTTLQAYLDYS